MRLVVLLAIACGVAPARADSVGVKVTEVAGGVAYLSPGRAAGIVPGTKVRIGKRAFTVFEVTEKTCAIRSDRLDPGDTGKADIDRTRAVRVERLDKPRPAAAFDGQWPAPVMPAEIQHPEPVALGSGRAPGSAHVTVLASGFAGAANRHVDAEAEARVIASYDVWQERPLSIDLDVAGRAYTAGLAGRSPVFVRAAQLRYGDARDPRFAIGRLRYAASSVGMLDGARASVRFGALEASAFGGLVPDPVSNRPETAASRFGAELAYDAASGAWQPRIAVAAYGSTWEGAIDERRLALDASAGRGAVRVSAWGEAQQFAADNPWGARSVELTGAGASAQVREHGSYAGVDVGFLRPERSLRLAAVLPPEWLCTRAPLPGMVDEACAGSDYWTSATASAGLRTKRWTFDAIGSVSRSHGTYVGIDANAYVRAELSAGAVRLLGGGAAGRASFGSWMSAEGGVAFVAGRGVDITWRYRPTLLDYVASTGPALLHSIIADGRVALSSELDAAVSALATVGDNQKSIALLGTIVWRPLP
ncbi:MAG: hypothetical protein AB7T06_48090 [Kofleriaceae bacterium]